MKPQTHKSLVPFTNAQPLVPGKGGGLTHWRLQRDKQQLRDELVDLASVVRRMSEELIEELIFLTEPRRNSPEAIARRMSQITGALKRESGTLTSMFNIAELHPALQRIFNAKLQAPADDAGQDDTLVNLLNPPAESIIVDRKQKPSLRYVLSDHEFEILALVLAGETPKDIGAKLKITRNAVHGAMSHIRQKARELTGTKGEPNHE